MPVITRFGPFELRAQERVLLRDGAALAVGARALDVLIVLVEAAGALLTKDQLLQRAWPGMVVEEANVHVQVSHLRKLLGAQAIATVAPLGYRFTMPIDSAAPRTPPHNLPAQRTRFVGREAALDDAAARLAATRLLTFTGIGGSGKTRLALQLAARELHRQADGVWFVDLAPLEDATQAALALARALAVAQAGDSSLLALVQARVRDKSMLVVLDNCEHLLDAAADLAQGLLSASAGVRVLATSREALGLSGETVMPVRPLGLPAPGAAPADTVAAESVRLFIDRAGEAWPGVCLAGDQLATAAEICRRVDGIPLAIELAAAQLRVLSLAQILALLEQRFRLLVGGRRALPRQQTLLAVVQWSWDRLTADEQQLLAALAVCSEGCDLAAATALLARAVPAVDLTARLSRLVDSSMVQVQRRHDMPAQDETARYTLLETVRQFALERLQDGGDAAALRDRHRDHFLAFAETQERELLVAEQPGRIIESLDAERENLMRALAWCQHSGDVRSELRFVIALRHYWGARGLLGLGHEIGAAALSRAPAQGLDLERCAVLATVAQAAHWMGRHDEALQHVEQQLVLAQRLGDQTQISIGYYLRGDLMRHRGELAAAEAAYQEAVAAARRCGDERRLGNALTGLAAVAAHRGLHDEAALRSEELLALRRKQPHRFGLGVALLNCAGAAINLRRTDAAQAYLHEAWMLATSVQSRYLTQALISLAASWAALAGHWALAVRWVAADAEQRRELQMPADPVSAQEQQDDVERARKQLGDAALAAQTRIGAAMSHNETLAEVAAALAPPS